MFNALKALVKLHLAQSGHLQMEGLQLILFQGMRQGGRARRQRDGIPGARWIWWMTLAPSHDGAHLRCGYHHLCFTIHASNDQKSMLTSKMNFRQSSIWGYLFCHQL